MHRGGRAANPQVTTGNGQKAAASFGATPSAGRSRRRHRSRRRRNRTGNPPTMGTQRVESTAPSHRKDQQKPALKKVASMEDLIDLSDDPVPAPAPANVTSDNQTTNHPAEALVEKGKATKENGILSGKGRHRRRGKAVEKKK